MAIRQIVPLTREQLAKMLKVEKTEIVKHRDGSYTWEPQWSDRFSPRVPKGRLVRHYFVQDLVDTVAAKDLFVILQSVKASEHKRRYEKISKVTLKFELIHKSRLRYRKGIEQPKYLPGDRVISNAFTFKGYGVIRRGFLSPMVGGFEWRYVIDTHTIPVVLSEFPLIPLPAETEKREAGLIRNDGGRADAGYKGVTGDCVTRAIAIATGKPYQEVYDALNELAKNERTGKRKRGKSNARTGVYKQTYHKYLEGIGWQWIPTMKIGKGCTTHLRADELPGGRLIVRVSKHLTAVIDGVINDTHDPSRGGTRCVYGYFVKRVSD